jgi:hypothetical protein
MPKSVLALISAAALARGDVEPRKPSEERCARRVGGTGPMPLAERGELGFCPRSSSSLPQPEARCGTLRLTAIECLELSVQVLPLSLKLEEATPELVRGRRYVSRSHGTEAAYKGDKIAGVLDG